MNSGNEINRFVVHHSASDPDKTTVSDIRKWHVEENGWDDVGSWPSAAQCWPTDEQGNACIGDVVSLDSSECIVYSPHKTVALLGVEDLIVVEEDDVLLISRKQRCQDVKKLVEKLRSEGRDKLL